MDRFSSYSLDYGWVLGVPSLDAFFNRPGVIEATIPICIPA